MSLSAKEIMASVRATLDYPSPETLKNQLLLLKLQEKVEHYFNEMSLTDRNWFLETTILHAKPNEDDYIIPVSDWGRAVNAETMDLTDPYHYRREIEIIDVQDRNLFYRGTDKAFTTVGNSVKHTAMSLGQFRDPNTGEIHILMTPVPSIAADYRIFYEPNRPVPAGLTANLKFLDNFRNLLITDLALTCLPYARLDDPFKTDLAQTLASDLQAYGRVFEEYIQQDRQEQICSKLVWGGDRSGGEPGGYWF